MRQALMKFLPLILIWFAAFSCRTTIVTIGPLLPLLLKQLHLAPFWGGSLTALPLMIIAVISIPSGRLVDRVGEGVALVMALGLLSLGSFVPLMWATQPGLFIDVAAVGIGIGLAQPTLAKSARHLNPVNPTIPTTLYANGLVSGGFIASLTTTTLVLPLTGSHWTRVFAFWGAIALVTTIGWLFLTKRPADAVPNQPQTEPLSVSGIRRPGLFPVAVAFAAQGAVFYGLVTWLPDYFVRQGWPLAQASFPLALVSLGSILGGLTSPWLLRLGRGFRTPFTVVGAAMSLVVSGLVLLPSWADLWSFFAGATTAIIFTLGMAAPAELVPAALVGRASGIVMAVGYLGAVLGPLIYGALLPLGSATAFSFLVFCCIVVTGISLAIPSVLQYQSAAPPDALSSKQSHHG